MLSRLSAISILLIVLLAGCGAASIEEVLENDISHLEILNEIETKHGNVVFYKTESPSETYGARLIKANGKKWDMLLGSEIPATGEAENIAWAFQSSEDEPTFYYGLVKNEEIKRLTINETDAVIVSRERGYNLFYLLTPKRALSIQKNGEKGIQINGFSNEGELIYQRLSMK
ncbi:hypothetical protein [Virgibacillus sp. DJP39]|uniref:hypothetical protein n=1 Tax=Virgibacillus sp. DJP39 TaxID=3409790 RepID=UPI003BB6124A